MNIVHITQTMLPLATFFTPLGVVVMLVPVCSFFKTTVLVKVEKLGFEIIIDGGGQINK